MRLFIGCLLGMLLLRATLFAVSIEDRTVVRHEKGTTDASYGYIEILPDRYNNRTEGQTFPLILTLHGGGGTGNGTTNLGTSSMMKLVNDAIRFDRSTILDERGVIVIEPQSSGSWNTGALRTFILYLSETYEVDTDRIYVTGPSMGGAGTWNCVKNNGDLIAACVPICGRGPGSGAKYLNVPTWAFHGWDDATIPYTTSVDQCNKIAAAVAGVGSTDMLANYPHQYGNTELAAPVNMTGLFTAETGWIWNLGVDPALAPHPKITLLPNVGHNAWDLTWGNPEVFEWMLAYTRGGIQIAPTVTITDPSVDVLMGHGASVTLAGSATDADGSVMASDSLTWTSTIDGELGVGHSITTDQLSLGQHEISLRAVDSDGHSSVDKRRITVSRVTPHTVYVYLNSENTGTQPNRIWGSTGFVDKPTDTEGQPSSMQVSITDRFQNKAYDRFHLLEEGDSQGRITISGLSQQLLYTISCAIPISDRIQAQDFSDSFDTGINGNSKDVGEQPCLANNNGSWTEYEIEVDTAGVHAIELRTSGQVEGSVANIYSDGSLVGSIDITYTGSWTAWESSAGTVTLPAGAQTLRIEQAGAFRLNWLEIPGALLTSAPIQTVYSVGQQSVALDPYTADYAVLPALLPDSNGQLQLDITLAAGSLVGYLGELKIEAYTNPNPPVPDTAAPTAPVLAASVVSSTEVDLNWVASTDNVAVSHYVIRRDGAVLVANTSSTSFRDTGLEASTSYSYTVAAVDTSGNESAESVAEVVETNAIVMPPSLSSGLTEDLFAYWNFDEGTGSTAADGTGQHDGTITGATWDTSTGKFGNALSFDGTSDDVSVGTGNPVGNGDQLTLSLWATADSLSDSSNSLNGLIGKRNGYDSTMPFQFGIKQLVPRIERSGSGASLGVAIGSAVTGWAGYKHIVLTISGTTATVYIDGAVHGTGTYELGNATDAPMTIGSTTPTKAEWDGNIDDVAIWSRALSAEEVQLIYASGVEGLALDQISGFSSWASAFGLDGSTGKESGMFDNPDGDDLSNLGEFALAGDPLSSTDGAKFFAVSNTSEEVKGAGAVCYTIAVRAGAPVFSGSPMSSSVEGITYTINASLDLSDFDALVLVADPMTDGLPLLPEAYEYRSFCLDDSEGAPDSGFFQVIVSETAP